MRVLREFAVSSPKRGGIASGERRDCALAKDLLRATSHALVASSPVKGAQWSCRTESASAFSTLSPRC